MAFTAPENTSLNTARPSANRPPLPTRPVPLAVAGHHRPVGTVFCGAWSARPAQAQDRDAAPRQKTESPYFFVKSDNPGVDQLPLKSTHVEVRVSGVIADVTVVQTYKNEGQRAIEAKYVFPGSTRAAVHGMNVRLADRLITAKIREKQQARLGVRYAAKKEGKTAALLEQHLPNVFQMNVANILPGDDVKVELRYTELLVPTDGNYQFVFPTVVGPRYNSPQSGQANATWVAQPFLPKGHQLPHSSSAPAFDIHVTLNTPIGIKEVRSPSHGVNTATEAGGATLVGLQASAEPGNNRDFILDYRLAGDRIESGVMLYKGQDENFFLAMVEPPKAPPPTAISPRDYIFVVDISGSMHGFPLDTAKGVLRELIGSLRPSDTFNVLLFSGSNRFPQCPLGARQPGQYRTGGAHHRQTGRRRQHRADSGPQTGLRRTQSGRCVAHGGGRHRWLCDGGARSL
jgi:Ca-activated chloride channel family protein